MRTLYLIDGYAQFFRHYHAIRTPMTSPVTREPTNMTFGFVGLLLRLLGSGADADRALWDRFGGKPDMLAVALDVSGDRGTFRSQLYPEYKANRSEPPEDLAPQVRRCLSILDAIGVPVLGHEGVEADDVIATLVTAIRRDHPDVAVRMVSKDKDLKQLLDETPAVPGAPGAPGTRPGVALVDIHAGTMTDAKALMEQTGLRPAQVIDMLTLMGDTVDNVPGVAGVGEKTAAKLIAEHGSLDALLAHAHLLKGKQAENLKAAMPHLPIGRHLITLRHDVPVSLDLAAASSDSFRLERLIPILKELGFNRYQDDVRAILASRGAVANAGSTGADRGDSPATSTDRISGAITPARSPRSARLAGEFGGLFDTVDPGRPGEPAVPASSIEGASIGSSEAPPGAQILSGRYTCIRTRHDLESLVARLRESTVLAFDTETTSLSPHDADLCGISVSIRPGEAFYIPVRSPDPSSHLDERAVLDALGPILTDPAKSVYGHNLKYDLLVLRRAGVAVRLATRPSQASPEDRDGEPPTTPCDTMVASYLIDSSRSSHSLDALGQVYLKRSKQSIGELIGSGRMQRSFDTVPLELATPYAAADADMALQLALAMLPQLRAMGLMPLFSRVEMPLVEVLAELEWNGILVDPEELDRQRARLEERLRAIVARLDDESHRTIGRTFDPDSPRQLAAALFNTPSDLSPGLGIKPVKKTKTGYSTDAEVLEKLAENSAVESPIPSLILEYRQLSKLVGTYLVALKQAIHPRTGRVHSSFNQTVAATGRLASSDPNLQNIPIRTEIGRDIRKAFVAAPGHVLITADYSQIELRLLAHLSRDPALIEAFRTGADIHTEVAAQIHGVAPDRVTREQRSGAKMVNFGIVYGITPYGLARRLGISDKAAAEIIDGYKRRFSGITTFLEECVQQARRLGYVETMLRRRRMIPDIDSTNPSRRALAERTAINSVVQGSAADLIKLAMVDLHAAFAADHEDPARSTDPNPPPRGVRMLLQIHDELVFEAPHASALAARDIIVDRMQRAMQLCVPLVADAHMGKDWFEGK